MKKAYADTPDGQIHYVEEGAGRPLVLLHHTPRSWTIYRSMIPLLSGNRRVLALDALGFGGSDDPPRRFGAGDYAASLTHFLDAVGEQEADLVGMCTGATVALEAGVVHADRWTTVTLAGLPFFASDEERATRSKATAGERMGDPRPDGTHIPKLWRWIMRYLESEHDDSYVAGVFERDAEGQPLLSADGLPTDLDATQLRYLHDWVIDTTRVGSRWADTALWVYDVDVKARLAQLTMPTLLLGLEGPGFPKYMSLATAREAQALVPDGHLALIDAPDADARATYFHAEEMSAALEAFLGSA